MKVQILLSSYNGEKYIKEQIDSITRQIGIDISILVRDDASTDQTKAILEQYKSKGILDWYSGDNIKSASSFMNLITNASNADYYAFCDQDDVWDEDKLLVATEKLRSYDAKMPLLYFSKAQLTDKDLNVIAGGNYPKGAFKFGTALIRNNATGCTMVFNKKLLGYLQKHTPTAILMHDHWVYLLCLALGGIVLYDNESHMKYRQHEDNVVGGNVSFIMRLKRSGFYDNSRIRYNIAKELDTYYSADMPLKNVKTLKKLVNYPYTFMNKMALIFDKEVKTSSPLVNIALIFNILKSKL